VPGPFVLPGEYVVRLAVGATVQEQKVQVTEDPRLQVSVVDRKAWTDALVSIAQAYRDAAAMVAAVKPAFDKLPKIALGAADSGPSGELRDVNRVTRELQTRLLTLYQAVEGSTGAPTADQRSQLKYFEALLKVLDARVRAVRMP
jgi:hypothetical protein